VLFAFGLGFGVAFPLFSDLDFFFCAAAMPAVTPPMSLPVGGWLGNFPPFG
jgi:hypothetical protein